MTTNIGPLNRTICILPYCGWGGAFSALFFFLRGSKYVVLIIKSSCHFFQIYFGTVLVQQVGKNEKSSLWNYGSFSFANWFYLIHRLIICLYFLFLKPGSSLNLALKSVIRHDKLDNMKHGVLRDTLVEVSGIQILFRWIGLKKLA